MIIIDVLILEERGEIRVFGKKGPSAPGCRDSLVLMVYGGREVLHVKRKDFCHKKESQPTREKWTCSSAVR